MTVSTFADHISEFYPEYHDYNTWGNWSKCNHIRTQLRGKQFTWDALTRKGVSLPLLEDAYFSNCLISTWLITRRKRDWCRMQLQRVVEYLDLREG
tara:strand:- start:49 stop:336 length:288 start_codon:yes stop_codon:yes gene_type:complete